MHEIREIKDKVLDFMNQEVGKYGNGRMDVKQMGDLADIVKDLAEAEYYCSVKDAMERGSQDAYGYTPMNDRMMGYQDGGQRQGGGMMGEGRSGYGGNMMGHSDPVSAIRDMLMTASPDQRDSIRYELSNLLK